MLKDLKTSIGAGGVVREGDIEVQGEHVVRIEAFLVKKGCVKGVSAAKMDAVTLKPSKV